MQIIADLHTHTNVTDHAFSTLTEMVQAAHDMGLKAIAITNHGPTNPDGPHEWHFSNLNLVPRKMNGSDCYSRHRVRHHRPSARRHQRHGEQESEAHRLGARLLP